jgi:hypothetical protein
LIDDTLTKAAFEPRNLYLIPEFDVGNPNVDCGADTELLNLLEFVKCLVDGDIRDQLDAHKTNTNIKT